MTAADVVVDTAAKGGTLPKGLEHWAIVAFVEGTPNKKTRDLSCWQNCSARFSYERVSVINAEDI